MRTITYRGVLVAQSSIAHGGKLTGTTHSFRRESLVQDDGTLLAGVPVLSGSVIRGGLRRAAANLAQSALADVYGADRFAWPIVHALRSGGSLRERRAGEETITGAKQAQIRDLLPMLGVFGVSIGSRIISGRLMVDKAIPVARETRHLADYYGLDLANYSPPSVWELVQKEVYARQADVTAGSASHLIDNPDDVELPRGSGQMQYTHETLPMGTRLYHSLHLASATAVEQSFMDDLVTVWSANARVGGQLARGMGAVQPRYTTLVTDLHHQPATLERVDWRAHMREHKDELADVLRIL